MSDTLTIIYFILYILWYYNVLYYVVQLILDMFAKSNFNLMFTSQIIKTHYNYKLKWLNNSKFQYYNIKHFMRYFLNINKL